MSTIQKKKKKKIDNYLLFMKILNLNVNDNVAEFQGKYVYLKIKFLNIYNYI